MATRETNDQIPLEVDPETDHRSWRYSWEKPWKEGLTIKQAATELIIADQQQLENRAQRKNQKKVNKT